MGREGGIRPENVVWIFGTGRSGSTWLASMMGELAGGRFWNEPLVGRLFGEFYFGARPKNLSSTDFVMADRHRGAWLEALRFMVLNVARSRFPEMAKDDHLVIKEPNGSVGAPLLAEALPESRVVLLVRDPRDVVASSMDRHREGGEAHAARVAEGKASGRADRNPDAFVKGQANRYLRNVGAAKRAHEAHAGPKALVRYEELRADALGAMRRMYAALGVPVDAGELARVVGEHAWENIPEEEKGEGKFYRKAEPGGWREDLTPEQARIVEDVTAPLLGAFGPASSGP